VTSLWDLWTHVADAIKGVKREAKSDTRPLTLTKKEKKKKVAERGGKESPINSNKKKREQSERGDGSRR